MLTLRPYQIEAVDAIEAAWASGTRRPAVVLPTGAGKTVVFSELARRLRRGTVTGRSLVIAHRTELIQQAAEKIRSLAPDLRVGIVQANRDNTEGDVVVASVQTLVSPRRRARIRDVHTVIVDECHHATADSYMSVLAYFGCFDEAEGANAVGFTATMTRGDEMALGDVWQDVVYTQSIADMIRQGFLCPPQGMRVRVPDLNMSKVRKSHGDYTNSDLGKAIEGSLAPEIVAKAYAEHAPDDQGILFAPTVVTAGLYADALRSVGISAALVHGGMAAEERAKALTHFRNGHIQVLCNCMVLTEGTDLPMARVCVIGRPTLNHGLLIQMAGRVLRPHPGKDSALILDITGATERHSLLGSVELFGERVDVPEEREDREGEEREEVELDFADDLMAAESAGADQPEWVYGQHESVEVDLLRGSDLAWLRTYAGIWCLPAGERYIIVQASPKAGHWDVVWLDKVRTGVSGWVAREVMSLGYAMAFAEGEMTHHERTTARKEQGWKKREATMNQIAYLKNRLGMDVTPKTSRGEASTLIEQYNASFRIDGLTPAYARVHLEG